MREFQSLEFWKKSHRLTLSIYDLTSKHFPKNEIFGLTSQIRRAASSIPTNIAEGCGRKSNADFAHFIHIAIGSASEVEYELLLAKDLKYIDKNNWKKLRDDVIEVRKMMHSFTQKLIAHNS